MPMIIMIQAQEFIVYDFLKKLNELKLKSAFHSILEIEWKVNFKISTNSWLPTDQH